MINTGRNVNTQITAGIRKTKSSILGRSVAVKGSSREMTFDVGPEVFTGIFQADNRAEEKRT